MSSSFDASASLLGYLFQCRLALVDSVRRLRRGEAFTVGIETLDDVVFESEGSPAELLQAKHHINSKANLTDSSSDLWKSLRIWIEQRADGTVPTDAVLYLVTTSSAGSGGAASYLRADGGRDPVAARERLDAVAQSSSNETNLPAYRLYAKLPLDERSMLIERVFVVDQHPDIAGLEVAMREELAVAVEREFVPALVSRLEGWWFRRVIGHLRVRDTILSEEVDSELDRLRNQFRPDNLPIDDDLHDVVIDEAAFSSHVFVEQLRLVGVSNIRLLNAMRQYFRAFEQRSRWTREGFLLVGELGKYDARLVEEWDIRFNAMKDDIGESPAEAEMRAAARVLYKWAEIEANLIIRPGCSEPFIPRGSLQILAHHVRVGWHPEFLTRLTGRLDGEDA